MYTAYIDRSYVRTTCRPLYCCSMTLLFFYCCSRTPLLLIVVHEADCCSVVTVNTSNSVKALTLTNLNFHHVISHSKKGVVTLFHQSPHQVFFPRYQILFWVPYLPVRRVLESTLLSMNSMRLLLQLKAPR